MLETLKLSSIRLTLRVQPGPATDVSAPEHEGDSPPFRASAKKRLGATKTCQRGHTYSTEGAPEWLGNRCPTCRTVGKAEWEQRRMRIRAGGFSWSYGAAPSLEVKQRFDELRMDFAEKQRREYRQFSEELEAEARNLQRKNSPISTHRGRKTTEELLEDSLSWMENTERELKKKAAYAQHEALERDEARLAEQRAMDEAPRLASAV